MQLAGHTLSTPDDTLPDALAMFAAVGLEGAEIVYQDDYPSGLPVGDVVAARRAATVAGDVGIQIIALTPYATGLNADSTSARKGAVDEFRAAIATAHEVGAHAIRVYGGSWHDTDTDIDREPAWGRLVDSLAELAPVAAQADVVLCVENHFGTMTQSAADTASLVRQLAHPAVRVLYDQANLTFTHDEDVPTALALQGDLIGHVHVKDLVFTDPNRAFHASETARVKATERNVRSRVVGEGIVPWPSIIAELAHRGYDAALSLEYEYRWHRQDLPTPAIGLARSVQHLRAVLAELEVAK